VALRVFLVEDLQNMQLLLQELLTAVGGLSIAASAVTEAEAKLWLDENPAAWDVAVIDLVLQEGSGFGVLPRARARGPQQKIVVFSGYITDAIRGHCERLGADAVFDKTETVALSHWLASLAKPA